MIPYRLDLAGGWLDQPFVSGIFPGSVITLSIRSETEYEKRCGLATSTREAIKELYSLGLPKIDSLELAKLVFNCENKPENKNVSGAQDAIGICVKGLSRHFYKGRYWPRSIEICQDEKVLNWLEEHIFLKLLRPRPPELDPLTKEDFNYDYIQTLSFVAMKCWEAIMDMDLKWFAYYLAHTYATQTKIFPMMAVEDKIPQCMGWKLAGAGGGGYVIMVNDKPCGERITVNR